MADYLVRSEYDRARLINFLQSADLAKPIKVTVTEIKANRSKAQNSLLWKWNGEIQQHMREAFGQMASDEEWHEILVSKLCPSEIHPVTLPDGTRYRVGRARTSKFKVDQMTQYLELLDAYCAESLNLLLPHPEDLVYAIWGERCAA